ncbi:helix-turn-helix transcriptional regulator [Mesorhizobium sp. B1-1-7]|nr:helix-turn-helix transcriptional regulator [Mesorhizobium sp. B1-1-7]
MRIFFGLHVIRLRIICVAMSAIRHIRLHIFGVTQAEFAALAGVTQASVSRWEAGVAPSLDDMRAIREAAIARGIAWDDAWFFAVPGEAVAAEPVGEPQRAAAGHCNDFDAAPPGVAAGPDASQAGAGLSNQRNQEMAE